VRKNEIYVHEEYDDVVHFYGLVQYHDLKGCRKCHDDVAIVGVSQSFNFWKFLKNATPEMESNETEYNPPSS
jgi:hypothetical protein